ncbi:MAG: hypothetical protein KJ798_06850 [Gammaproteobacteria bacterium]|uniref:hypothetical protein n=1 Tax=Limnobacter sp. TaxID=2003368 RepID=UPI001DA3D0DD|nr:hypothetical protein [Limnobacter sp.]MBU0784489.1 hypothetical protein [Gammaproteobacteria bacterium]MBU0847874.1 hypothetical protein [Gammaproteobacteria bacterium]MBU1269006.1 hypothetical protein [Gammaproteobacteria bacterium]MBU1529660.1 hypothetical protein [Gammaproteobacteria bacterium]MBU1780089.1 hypothetical protein [Gammaproteobacteria bacterium]
MRRMLVAMCVLAGLAGLVGAGLVQAAPITADKAVTRLNQEVQVQMKVRSSKLRTDRDEVDLNSHTNFRDPANLAVVIDGRVAAWYSYQGIHDLPKFFFGKTIVVSGLVEQFAGQNRILVFDPAQVQILK